MRIEPAAVRKDAIRVSVKVTGDTCELSLGDRQLFFRADAIRGREPRNYDFALLALIVASATTGERFVLDYPVTQRAKENFGRYARLLRLMAPDEFFAADVTCPQTVEQDRVDSGPGAICLSGGVDAVYAGLSHQGMWSHGMLIKGADYALSDTAGFDDLRRRVTGIASEIGLQVTIMETNFREIMSNYRLQHAGLLASCLHCLGAFGFGRGAYAADYAAWHELVAFPWGSLTGIAETVTTDAFPIAYIGDGLGRSEKVRRIAETNPKIFSHMSVCWSDTTHGGSCGHCGKCMRTRLNLYSIRDDGLRRDIELALFGNHVDPVEYVKSYQIQRKPKLVQREIGWFDDIMLALPDGELRRTVEVLVSNLMDAYCQRKPEQKRAALIPRVLSLVKRR